MFHRRTRGKRSEVTSTINQPTGPTPAKAKPEPQRGKAKKNTRNTWVLVIAAVVVVVALVAFIASRGDNGEAEREMTRVKAEAVLRARFNDTDPGVGPLVSMSVTYKGDQLVATWTQGEVQQKRCTAPVLVSDDGQSFGIASFEAVPFERQDSAPATCVSTEGLQYGLPLP